VSDQSLTANPCICVRCFANSSGGDGRGVRLIERQSSYKTAVESDVYVPEMHLT